MKRILFVLSFGFFALLFLFPQKGFALYDPLSRDNNIVGVHILSPSEIEQAAKLVNANGGDWGYVTIPIQSNDRNIEKWQKFMDDAKRFHVIPIIRIATEPDPANTSVWRIPDKYDIVDFANFLNSLDWPVENRYVIIFNEVNRYDEWGGQTPDPAKYASLLDYSVDTFKMRSPNFFIISSGLDDAAPNDGVNYISDSVYLRDMEVADPRVFDKIDGIGSHSYPNPGFKQPPSGSKVLGITSYRHEYAYINTFTNSNKPVFITETGWDASAIGDTVAAAYYKSAFQNYWNPDKDKIVAVTPFLLEAGAGPFDKFSFMRDGNPTAYYNAIDSLKKIKGQPVVEKPPAIPVLAKSGTSAEYSLANIVPVSSHNETISPFLKLYFKLLLGL